MTPHPHAHDDIVERLRAQHRGWLANCRLSPHAKDESNFSAAASTDPKRVATIISDALREA